MSHFLIVPAIHKKGFNKFVVDCVKSSRGVGIPVNINSEYIFDIEYVLPNVDQLKAGLPHYYDYFRKNCEVSFWCQKIYGDLAQMKTMPLRVDIHNKNFKIMNQLFCYYKE